MAEFLAAVERVTLGPEKKSRSGSQKEKEMTAYHEAGHAVVQYLTKDADPIHKVTIIPRGNFGGATMALPEKDRTNYAKSWCLATIKTTFGGRIAEEMFCGDVNTGAISDIRQATNLARKMVREWGMSPRLGFIYFGEDETKPSLLGEFGGGKKVRLTLDSLPAHRLARVEIELFILPSWNGQQRLEPWSKDRIGPDTWTARVVGGPTLVSASFSTVSVGGLQYFKQSYPDDTDTAEHDPRTGASESNTLGYTHWFGESPEHQHVPCDVVYKLSFLWPHDKRELAMEFESVNVGNDGGATWGLDNVRVELLDKPPQPEPTAAQFDALWSALGGQDPLKASEALWRLAA